MALEAYSQFHAFDWQNDTDWLKHKANLFVSDDSDQAMLKVRQKWFKLNINPEFDPAFKPAVSASSESADKPASESRNSPNEQAKPQEAPKQPARPSFPISRFFLMVNNLLVLVHAVLAAVNIFSYVLLGPSHFAFALGHAAASYGVLLFQAIGRPQFNLQYVQTMTSNDSMHYIMYSMVFITAKTLPVAIFPVVVYALINCSILVPRFLASMDMSIAAVNTLATRIKTNKDQLLQTGANLEVVVFASLAVAVITGDFSYLLTLVLYWNFITQRWNGSVWTRNTVAALETGIDGYLLSPRSPTIVASIYTTIKNFVRRMATRRTAQRAQ